VDVDELRLLLTNASFGKQVAEDEAKELASYFVETSQWQGLWRGDYDVVLGPKGSGKSALYSLLDQRGSQLFDRKILTITAENPSGTTAFSEVVPEPPTSETAFIGLWKLYFLSLVAKVLLEYGVETEEASAVYDALRDAGLLEPQGGLAGRVRAVLDYINRLAGRTKEIEGGVVVDPVTGMPALTGKIVLGEPGTEERKQGLVSVDELLKMADAALKDLDFSVWILLDRLDVAFEQHAQLEHNALRALFKTYRDMGSLERITPKIFLRSDIWDRITEDGFREASHISAELRLKWDDHDLLQLLMRRVFKNPEIAEFYGVDPEAVYAEIDSQRALLKELFPDQIDGGKNPKTFDWMVSRTTDATGESAPRELIHLLSALRVRQLNRLDVGNPPPPERELFERAAFKEALDDVSEARLKKLLYAEYPDLKPYIEKLDGEKTLQRRATLASIWQVDENEAGQVADRLVAVGFFSRGGDKADPEYQVPFLYRPSLSLVRGSAKLEDEE
jgi:hypothetical protein